MFMLPPRAATEEGFAQHPIGTGPFRFVEHRKDVSLVLEANPDYWGGAPEVKTVVYRPIPDPSARLTAIQTGEVDIATGIPPDLVSILRQAAELTVLQIPGIRIAHFPFNFRNQESPIANVQIRGALTFAIDGDSILKNVLAGAGYPLKGPVPSTLFAAADLGGYTYDPERAKVLLAEAGYPKDHELTLIYTQGEFIKDREITEAVQAQLQQVGVRVTIEILESGAYSERRSTPNWDIAINGFSAMNGDPTFFLSWATGPAFGYENPEVEGLIKQSSEILDEQQRAKILTDAQRLYWEDVPYLWGYTQADTIAINKRVHGIQVLNTGWISFGKAMIAG